MKKLVLVAAILFLVIPLESQAQSITTLRLDSHEGKPTDLTLYHLADVNKPGHEPDFWAYNLGDPARLNIWVGSRWNTGTPGLRTSLNLSWTPESSALQLLPGLLYSRCDSHQRISGWADVRIPLTETARAQATLMDARKEWQISHSGVFVGLCGRATLGEDGRHESHWGLGLEVPAKNFCITARWLPLNGTSEARIDFKYLGF